MFRLTSIKNFLRFWYLWVLEGIFPLRQSEALVRSTSASDIVSLLRPQQIDTMLATILALLPYRAADVQACVVEAKFHANKQAQKLLGSVLTQYFRVNIRYAVENSELVLVPIPLGKKRRKDRGYNQIEAIASCTQGFRLESQLLMRTRDTIPQTSLGRTERLENMRDSFAVNPSQAHKINPVDTYVILDDVVTTGATLIAARDALQCAGAEKIILLALCH